MKICKGCQMSDCPNGYQICYVECDEKCNKRCNMRWGHCEIRKSQLPQPQLKPCPFCGGKGKLILDECMTIVPCKVKCQNVSCGAEIKRFCRGDIEKIKNHLIEAWNRRVGDDK